MYTLLVPENGRIDLSDGKAVLSGNSADLLEIRFTPPAEAKLKPTEITVAGKKLSVLELSANSSLTYQISFPK